MFDMSLWGPHGLRTLGKAVFKSHVLNAPWEWSKKEQPGLEKLVPCKTFKVAMVSSRRVRPRAVGGVHGAHQVPQAVWRDVLGGDLLGLGKVKVENPNIPYSMFWNKPVWRHWHTPKHTFPFTAIQHIYIYIFYHQNVSGFWFENQLNSEA